MNYNEDYILEDELVRLRPLQSSDFDHLLPYAIDEPDIWSFNAGGAAGRRGQCHLVKDYNSFSQRLFLSFPQGIRSLCNG